MVSYFLACVYLLVVGVVGGCCRQQNILNGISRLCHICDKCAQYEFTFICEEHRGPVVNWPMLVLSSKCQTSCTVLGFKSNFHLWTSGPHTNHLSRRSFVACWRSLCRALAWCSSCSSLHKGRGSCRASGLLPSCSLLHV